MRWLQTNFLDNFLVPYLKPLVLSTLKEKQVYYVSTRDHNIKIWVVIKKLSCMLIENLSILIPRAFKIATKIDTWIKVI